MNWNVFQSHLFELGLSSFHLQTGCYGNSINLLKAWTNQVHINGSTTTNKQIFIHEFKTIKDNLEETLSQFDNPFIRSANLLDAIIQMWLLL